jgi:hypothetical protein
MIRHSVMLIDLTHHRTSSCHGVRSDQSVSVFRRIWFSALNSFGGEDIPVPVGYILYRTVGLDC